MGKKNKSNIRITFCGKNATEVTGSMILVETPTKKILLECGLFQSNNLKSDYKINARKFEFNPKDIDYVFVLHSHADHCALVPKLFKGGFEGKVITTKLSAKLMSVMLYDSAHIIEKDSEYLSKITNTEVYPIYSSEHIDMALQNMYEYGFSEVFNLDEEISFKFLHNSHIIGAAQLELFIKEETGHIKKILYTSDIGSDALQKSFVDKNEYCKKANIAIVESTYGDSDRIVKKKDREKDIEKLKCAIETVCMERKGRILIPCFSLDRSQYMLKLIYDIFKDNKNFNIPVIIDSPLTCRITDVYKQHLEGENKDLIEKITSWRNVKFVSDYATSKILQSDKTPKIVISSSGMLSAGRSVNYLKAYISNPNDMIMFVGFSSQNSLASRIKNGKENKTITIEKKSYPNKCDIMDLKSFSSHIQKSEMISYYKSIQCDAIYLVHGEASGKLMLKKDLEIELSKLNKTTRVIATNGTTVCHL